MASTFQDRLERHKAARSRQIFVFALLAFGLLTVVAFILDMTLLPKRRTQARPNHTGELQQIILGMDHEPYVDKKKLFSIIPPTGWKVTTYPKSRPHNVRFIGKNGADISITASRVEYNSFNALLRRIKAIEKKYGLNMNIEPDKFVDKPAVKRMTTLHHTKVVSYDFVESNVAHHIQMSVPHSMFDKYEPVLRDVLNTYRPLPAAKK